MKTKLSKKRVKAWAVLKDGYVQGATPLKASLKLSLPLMKTHHPKGLFKIVPCEITYSVSG